ncbi:MAG: radical SAM family heme chaperone HemW [Gammaproteobacteria bacterium]|nr:radical SAM family heme chaperone HemW [Gammaproteobacteria bacterium]
MTNKENIPLALYIHLPWCVRKCPYCDFNSHELKQDLPEVAYVERLLKDLSQDVALVQGRVLSSIFIGGGTPSLFSPSAIERLLGGVEQLIPWASNIEITMEANPGTVEQGRFTGFRGAGVNRLSIGVQSFNDRQLERLGRIHDSATAERAIDSARASGFDNFNIDLMFGLPEQTQEEALSDIARAIEHQPKHVSWYQLTIEPNTVFHHRPPTLPVDEAIWSMQESGQALLSENGYIQYEISAYSQPDFQCRHNRNYWEFGDYLGIGAGAHAKITDFKTGDVARLWKTRHPKAYLDSSIDFIQGRQVLNKNDLIVEFMLNALRLYESTDLKLLSERTGISASDIGHLLVKAQEKGLLKITDNTIETTLLGKHHLNELLLIFS